MKNIIPYQKRATINNVLMILLYRGLMISCIFAPYIQANINHIIASRNHVRLYLIDNMSIDTEGAVKNHIIAIITPVTAIVISNFLIGILSRIFFRQ